jgi:hypothetical protein
VGDRGVDEDRPEDREQARTSRTACAQAKAPVMSAGVMAANISWNIANNMNGIVVA